MNKQRQTIVPVYQARTRRECLERALILASADIDYRLARDHGSWAVVVQAGDAARARVEIDSFTAENVEPNLREDVAAPRFSGRWGVLVYAVILIALALLQHRAGGGHDWLSAGKMSAAAVRDGQWCRTITSLTLHADIQHLAANLAFGILFGLFAGQLLGSGLAGLSMLVAGASGNLLNAFLQPPSHTAVGASTAIFAVLGLLSAHAWSLKRHSERRWSRRLAPLIGGVALLALTGAGGPRTDVLAHISGFVCGVLLGVLYGAWGTRWRSGAGVQLAAGTLAIVVVVLAWRTALVQQSPGMSDGVMPAG